MAEEQRVSRSARSRTATHAYVEVEYQTLTTLDKTAIESFLQRYDYVSKLRKNDNLTPMPLKDCIDQNLYEVIVQRNRDKFPEIKMEPQEDVDPPAAD